MTTTETWQLLYGFHENDRVTVPCLSQEDGERQLAWYEQTTGYPVRWAQVVHQTITISTENVVLRPLVVDPSLYKMKEG